MSRIKALVATLAVVGISAVAGPVSAQDGPTVTIEPASVEAGGEATLTVSGSGFTVTDLFVVPCEGAQTVEDLANAGDGACDLTNLTPAPLDGGEFSVEITYEIPDEGMCFAVGDLAQTEVSGACVEVAASDDTESTDDDTEADEETTTTSAEELAGTGTDTNNQFALMGGLLVVAGLALVAGRRIAAN